MLSRIAVPLAAVSVAIGVLRLTVIPADSVVNGLLAFISAGCAAVLFVGQFMNLSWPRPSRLEHAEATGGPSFVVPAHKGKRMTSLAFWWALTSALVPFLVDSLGIFGLGMSGVLVTMLVVVTIIAIGTSAPDLILRPDGITVGLSAGGWAVPWEALRMPSPRYPHAARRNRFNGTMYVVIVRPDLARFWGSRRTWRTWRTYAHRGQPA